MSCNHSRAKHGFRGYAGFQSLSGFPMSCNIMDNIVTIDRHRVSIPIGFSNELQRGILPARFGVGR
mgnify:FL=1